MGHRNALCTHTPVVVLYENDVFMVRYGSVICRPLFTLSLDSMDELGERNKVRRCMSEDK